MDSGCGFSSVDLVPIAAYCFGAGVGLRKHEQPDNANITSPERSERESILNDGHKGLIIRNAAWVE